MKRNLFFILFVIAMALLLISCGGSQVCTYAEKEKTNYNPTEAITIDVVVVE
ncbi:MAG: hypothetical protein HKN90_01490 [Flavobacteriaceae bacterium]|nr:hypothetical protein [Flavobacteriaceae bacterium]